MVWICYSVKLYIYIYIYIYMCVCAYNDVETSKRIQNFLRNQYNLFKKI